VFSRGSETFSKNWNKSCSTLPTLLAGVSAFSGGYPLRGIHTWCVKDPQTLYQHWTRIWSGSNGI
jgi:hypothetical protein